MRVSNRYNKIVLISIIIIFILSGSLCFASIDYETDTSWFTNIQKYSQSAHGELKCEECHGDMKENGQVHPDLDLNNTDYLKIDATRKFDYEKCKSCHPVAYNRYLKGKHAEALKDQQAKFSRQEMLDKPLKEKAPTCGNCHSVHTQSAGMSRVEIGQRMTFVCGLCHPKRADSYLDNFHGKAAVNLKNDNAAYCSDCHGAHKVTNLEDKQEKLHVCQRCHLEAQGDFADILIHSTMNVQEVDKNEKDQPYLASLKTVNKARLIAIIVVVLFLVFFFGHTLLSFLREWHQKLRKKL